jgi:hypothetical protein
MPEREFLFTDGQPLSGIVAYLTQKFGGNLHGKGVVSMSASSVALDSCPARRKFMFDEIERIFAEAKLPDFLATKGDSQITRDPTWGPDQALDFDKMSTFNSMNKPNQWIIWDFKEISIRPTAYTLQSGFWNFPKTWVVEGSNDGEKWVQLDSQTGNAAIKKCMAPVTITIQSRSAYRYIKLGQGAKNHCGSDHLVISAFELFGTLVAPFEVAETEAPPAE